MNVKKAIELLSEYPEDTELVIAWWDNDSFENISPENWVKLSDATDRNMDWSSAHEDIQTYYDCCVVG